MDSNQNKSCYNCFESLPDKAIYCPNCGQKNTDGKISLKQFINGFLESVLSLDSRFLKTIFNILIPAKLTRLYFEGKHKSYSHPLRLFFGLAVIHMAIIGFVANKYIELPESTLEESKNKVIRAETYELIENFENEHGALINNEEVIKVLDTIKSYVWEKANIQIDTVSVMPVPYFNPDSLEVSYVFIKEYDLAKLTKEELITKYGINNYITKLILTQIIKARENPKSVIIFGLSNMIWMLLILLPMTALFMKILYIRRKFFFVEHLVFLLNWHSLSFILVSLYLLISIMNTGILGLLLFLILLWGYLSLKKYYKQGHFKSIIKFIMILTFYLFVLIISITITAAISALVY